MHWGQTPLRPSPRPYRISQSIWSPLFRSKHPFYTQRPFASTGIAPLPRYYGLVRLLASLSLPRGLPSSLAELSEHAILLCPAAPARPKPIRALGAGFTASELLAARNSSNETLRRRFICIATHLFVRQDSRIRVAPLTACSALRAIPSLRSALTAFGGYVLITSRFVCDSCSFHHDSSAKLVLAYLTLGVLNTYLTLGVLASSTGHPEPRISPRCRPA